MNTRLLAQIIKTTWTKDSRGGKLATLRNAIPLAFPIPDLQSGQLLVQHMIYGERDAFKTPATRHEEFPLTPELLFKYGSFALDWNGLTARTEFHDSYWYAGAPRVKSTNFKIGHFRVGSGEWVRLRWQGRFTDYDTGHWWYEHTCINVVHFEGNEDYKLFLQSEPAHQFVHLPELW